MDARYNNSIGEIFQYVMNICKEKHYEEIQKKITETQKEILQAESLSRQKKASMLIECAYRIEIKLNFLQRDYKKIMEETSLEKIDAVEDYINECRSLYKSYLKQKNSLK